MYDTALELLDTMLFPSLLLLTVETIRWWSYSLVLQHSPISHPDAPQPAFGPPHLFWAITWFCVYVYGSQEKQPKNN